MSLRAKIAGAAAKGAKGAIRLMGRGSGATVPGLVARRVDSAILPKLRGQVRGKVIAVMGTNGKTTTNALIYKILKGSGHRVIINRTGANMLNGITAAFVLASRRGKINADFACIEVDEFAAKKVLPQLQPDVVLLTNVGRDQLDRFGEVDITLSAIRMALESVPSATVVLNADDVLSYSMTLDCKNPPKTFGINEDVFPSTSKSDIRESIFCRQCGSKLSFDFFHYAQLGKYHCEKCGFSRPKPDFLARDIVQSGEDYRLVLQGDGSSTEVSAKLRNQYNVYNLLAAFSALSVANVPLEALPESVAKFDFGNNREETFNINGAKVQLHLAKNPMGFQQKVAAVCNDPEPKDVIILINDNTQDGEDVSWLWDVDFQHLAAANVNRLVCTGLRRYDMGLRLKYEGIGCEFTTDMRRCVSHLADEGTKNLYIIVNYTGLYRTNALLHELEDTAASAGAMSDAGDAKAEVADVATDERGIEEFVSDIPKPVEKLEKSVTITHLYPDLLNLYGDRGNIMSMVKRCELRGISAQVRALNAEDEFNLEGTDIVLLGGGSDREQAIVCDYLLQNKQKIEEYVQRGGFILAVCGGYQLLGKYYKTADKKIEGLGLIDVKTDWAQGRLVSNVVLKSDEFNREVVGFENHGGRTTVGDEAEFGSVLCGYGNDDSRNSEGVISGNIIATYLHGPLLPKNPEVCDWLLEHALGEKLAPLDDTLENKAAEVILKRGTISPKA